MRASTSTSTAVASTRATPVMIRPYSYRRSPLVVGSRNLQLCSAVSTLQETSTAAEVTEVTAETIQPFLEQNAEGLTVVDFFTQWCGPCKMMNPVMDKLSREFGSDKVKFAKFDCSAKEKTGNKGFALSLGISALPTFHIYKGKEKVAELTGAKPDQLRRVVAQHAPSHARPIRRRTRNDPGASNASMASTPSMASHTSLSSMG